MTTAPTTEAQLPEGWELSAGGMLDDENITIVGSEFGYDANYQSGQVCVARLTYLVDGETEPGDLLLSMGDGWEPLDGGATAGKANGSVKKINKTTNYGVWIANAIPLAGQVVTARGHSLQADVWLGTRWHVVAQENVIPARKGQEERRFTRTVPTEFLGLAQDASNGAQAALTATAPAPVAVGTLPANAPAATPATAPAQGDDQVPAAMKLKLMQAAKANNTHDAFMSAAVLIEGINDCPQALEMVIDDAWWASQRG